MTDAPTDRSAAFTAETVTENYERLLAPVIFEPWADRLVEAARIGPGDRVLDVASGTGAVARAAARRAGSSGRVTASDVSPAMLKRSAERPPAPGAAPIEFVPASAEAIPLPDALFDAALCQQGLQFFPNRAAAAAELRRLLRPRGRLAVSVWTRADRLVPFGEYAEALAAAGVEPPFPGALDPQSFGFDAEEMRALLIDAGLADVEVSIDELTISWPDVAAAAAGVMGTPYAPLVAALAPDRRAAVQDDLLARFEALGATQTMRAVIGTARAV